MDGHAKTMHINHTYQLVSFQRKIFKHIIETIVMKNCFFEEELVSGLSCEDTLLFEL